MTLRVRRGGAAALLDDLLAGGPASWPPARDLWGLPALVASVGPWALTVSEETPVYRGERTAHR